MIPWKMRKPCAHKISENNEMDSRLSGDFSLGVLRRSFYFSGGSIPAGIRTRKD